MEESDSLQQNQQGGGGFFHGMINVDFSYVLDTWLGRVKLLQLITVTLAGSILPSAIGVFFTRFSFYTFVVWTSFMYISIDLLLHITTLWKRLPKLCHTPAIWIYPMLIGALSFMISSSLVLSVADVFPDSRSARCAVSGAFGLITMLLFLVEAFLHYRESKQDDERNVNITMPTTRGDDEPPPYLETQSRNYDRNSMQI